MTEGACASGGWNPRYVAYAKAHGMTPPKMLAHDRQRFEGGCMAGFMAWISTEWRAWAAGRTGLDVKSGADHEAFDGWLASPQMVLEVAA